MRILGISGSLRHGSYNTGLLRACASMLGPDGHFEIAQIGDLPFYNEDLRAAGFPPPALRFRAAVRGADAIVIATPEYNRSVPGVLKNAIDWASRQPDQPFAGKPVAVIGASNSKIGTALANYHVRQILVYLDTVVVAGPEVMVGEAKSKFDADGNLLDDATRAFVGEHLAKLIRLSAALRTLAPLPA